METLNLKYNTCKIDLKVAGQDSHGSGFLYVTSADCNYNYVITAKHIFSEDSTTNPVFANIEDISIMIITEDGLTSMNVFSDKLEDNFLFHATCDIAIIRVCKVYLNRAVKVWVKNYTEVTQECMMKGHGYPRVERSCPISFELYYYPDDKCLIHCKSVIKNICHFHGISGGGIHLIDEPYLISVISKYPFDNFEMNYFKFSEVDWDEINEILGLRHWHKLARKASRYTRITHDKIIIDLQEICINGAQLNLDTALKRLRHDMIDDWFFDPLRYIDICNRDFVLDYFSNQQSREQYKFHEMEVFYLPKESLVQRKAMVGNFIDRLLYIAIVEKLAPIMEKYISSRIYAARFNRSEGDSLIAHGVKQWIKMNYLIDEWLDNKNGCLFKCDILNYYDNISHKILINFLSEITTDADELNAIKLLEQMLSEVSGPNTYCGLPQNSDASSLLATFYLSHVDIQIQAQATEYCRFMDDIYFMAPNYFVARNILQSLEKELRRLNLCLNSSKITFVDLSTPSDVREFKEGLSLYNHINQQIKQLISSESLGRRENGIALLVNTLNEVMNVKSPSKEISREKKFLLYILCNYPLTLMPYWNFFYKNLLVIINSLKVAPVDTPLVCRLISCINPDRNLDDAKRLIADMLMRKGCDIYPWQAYHFWLLLAYLKYDAEELVGFAATELERNDRTHRIENAAIIIYLSSVRPSYRRVIMNMLGKQAFHGYMQIRAALIACRSLNPNLVAEQLPDSFQFLAPVSKFLYRNKEEKLIFMGQVSSYIFKSIYKPLFPDLYSGL